MSVLCLRCRARYHEHSGRCGAVAEIEIRTSGGVIIKHAACECVSLGRSDADTQREVTR